MKIEITEDSCMQTFVHPASEDSPNTLDITDEEWQAFNEAEEHYESLLSAFKARQLSERQLTMGEIGQLRARLAQLEARLGVKEVPQPAKPASPIDETDFGRGVGSRMPEVSAGAFRSELAELRDRTTEKRRRRG